MTRIVGVDLPNNKKTLIALTYIYGIGRNLSKTILKNLKIDPNTILRNLSESDLVKLRQYIEKKHMIEGDLRRFQLLNIKRLIDIGCYKGRRHRQLLPVRGQRTRTNSRTCRIVTKNINFSKK
uniref:Ribosomal protein S13 n=1 Tax=Cyanidium sp. THAL103 TaxID=3027999 RepID=A0A9Y1I484_9RHOD|nr:ribosomal protein S13 [Cyanidium sp. THAL103]